MITFRSIVLIVTIYVVAAIVLAFTVIDFVSNLLGSGFGHLGGFH